MACVHEGERERERERKRQRGGIHAINTTLWWWWWWYIYMYVCMSIYIVVRAFANWPGDRSSILSRVIPKTQKMVRDTSLLNTQHYKVRKKGNWSNPVKGVATFPTPRCSSYWKGNLLVALNYSLSTYIYIHNDNFRTLITSHTFWNRTLLMVIKRKEFYYLFVSFFFSLENNFLDET